MGNSIHYFSHLCDRSSNKANEHRKDIFWLLFEGTVGDTEEDMVWGAALSCVSEYEAEGLVKNGPGYSSQNILPCNSPSPTRPHFKNVPQPPKTTLPDWDQLFKHTSHGDIIDPNHKRANNLLNKVTPHRW